MKRALLLLPAAVFACETFVAPPAASVAGGPVLTDPAAPLVVRFDRPYRPETLRLEVVPYDVDVEGNLADETDAGGGDLHAYFTHDPAQGDFGGASRIGPDTFTILPNALPVGRKLALLVEPGLASDRGVVTRVRDRLLFSYQFQCAHAGAGALASGPYVFLLDVESPIGTQIQLFAELHVDPATGDFVGQFTNADRNRDGSRCPGGCPPEDACRTIPAPECVAPSLRAASVDEWPDYVPNVPPPTGYSFTVHGCANEAGGAVVLGTEPVDLVVQQPAVTARGLVVIASFARDPEGVLRATGSGTAADILLGTKSFGPARGTVAARSLPAAGLPPGIPYPP